MPEPGTIDAPQLTRLSGLGERRLRELVEEGWLPAPERGRYPLVPAIQGLLRYYRERDEKRQLQDCYDSIGSCASATGIPLTTIKHAKRKGCAAFRGSRVYVAALLKWIFDSPERSTANYDTERAQHVSLQNAKLKVELRRLRREVISVDEVRRVGAELGTAIRKVICRLHRIAPSVVGHPVEVVESRLKEEEDEILKQLHLLQEHLSRWEEPN